MGLLYAWATKEYLLWEMTIGQIILYHNKGMEIKYPDPNKKSGPSLLNYSADELRKIRDEIMPRQTKEELQAKYGDI
jgi:hypothetical protein